MKIRVLVVDDEPLACRHILNMLEKDQEFEILGECHNGREAVAAILNENPDLIFLDIQIPDLNGFEVLELIEPARRPLVIFTTAYTEYIARALDVQARGYLLKPIDSELFHDALAGIKREWPAILAQKKAR
jgi:two-component system LytT family response regulator